MNQMNQPNKENELSTTKAGTDAMKIVLDSLTNVLQKYINCDDETKLESIGNEISLLLDELARLQRKIIKQNSKKRGTKNDYTR